MPIPPQRTEYIWVLRQLVLNDNYLFFAVQNIEIKIDIRVLFIVLVDFESDINCCLDVLYNNLHYTNSTKV